MNAPLVSFIIPAFQQERFIALSVQSALDQRGARIEVIVTDDGSTDSTFECIRTIRDPRLKVFRQANLGPSAALNRCIAVAQGEWIAVLGGDDVAEPFRAAYQVRLADRFETDAVFSPPILINEGGQEFTDGMLEGLFRKQPVNWRPDQILRKLVREGNFLCAPTALLRRAAFDRVGLYNEALIQLQDFEHALRWTANGFSLRVADRPVTRYRRGANNVSGKHRNRAMERELFRVQERFFSFGEPAVWRQAFSDVLAPRVDLNTPLTVLETAALFFAHPQQSVQEHGPRCIMEAMESSSKPLSAAHYMTLMNAQPD